MRLGICGGSFDPVHNAHLALADACRAGARLDRVLLVPAAQQPFKSHGPAASAADRLRMVELAVADSPYLVASDIEIARGGVSYTIDTLSEVREQYPDARLFLLMGADTLHDLPNWRDPESICQLATPLAVQRAGELPLDFTVLEGIAPPDVLDEARRHVINMPSLPISSSDIRARIAQGESIDGLVPSAVAKFISLKSLYR